ncbi:MAG TPA: RNA polymerase factor sigma-54, partial [Bacteroidales bacterium]|nr:RNA polymerase factor sigma-54 [Bacteroidales bacterium]
MIKLLEVPTIQMEQRIKKELEENPALEEGIEEPEEEIITDEPEEDEINEEENNQDEFTLDDFIDEDYDIPEYNVQQKNYEREEQRREIPFSVGSTFRENLLFQLGLRELSEKQKILGEFIIGNIDEDGYLRRDLSSIVDDLAFLQNITTTEDELEEVLEVVQDLEPAGVGARNLQECLILQIKRKGQSLPAIKLAEQILEEHFEEFSKRHYDKIANKLGIEEDLLKSAIDEILKLSPKPGSTLNDVTSNSAQPIIPDFILEMTEDGFELHLNSRNLPELRLSKNYTEMLKNYSRDKLKSKEMKDAITFMKQKIDSARWFIDAIKQRQNTLLLTMNAILKYQEEYFKDGDETKLKPMILKDVAEMTGLDISTVSRVASSKYIQTHFGILPLKYFFSEGL